MKRLTATFGSAEWTIIGLLVALNLPLVFRYIGWWACGVYAVGAIALVMFTASAYWRRSFLYALIGGSLALQCATLLIVAPLLPATYRIDRASALTVWQSAVAHGLYPYAERTDLGNAISVLPTLPLLAWPFQLVGSVGFFEIFSYAVLVGLLLWHYRRQSDAARIAIGILATAPLLFFEVVAKSDVIANMVLLMLLLTCSRAYMGRPSPLLLGSVGILLGGVAATRIALLPILFVCVCYLYWGAPLRRWIAIVAIAAFVAALLIVPFIIWNPTVFFGFAPFGVNATKLGANPALQWLWLALTGGATLFFGLWAKTYPRLLLGITLLGALIVSATWVQFFVDLSYLQIVFIPLLFLLPATVPIQKGEMRDPAMAQTV